MAMMAGCAMAMTMMTIILPSEYRSTRRAVLFTVLRCRISRNLRYLTSLHSSSPLSQSCTVVASGLSAFVRRGLRSLAVQGHPCRARGDTPSSRDTAWAFQMYSTANVSTGLA